MSFNDEDKRSIEDKYPEIELTDELLKQYIAQSLDVNM